MNSHSLQPASDYTIPQLADLLTRGFEGYYIPIDVTESVLLSMLRRDGVSLEDSRVILSKGEPVGADLERLNRKWAAWIEARQKRDNQRRQPPPPSVTPKQN